MLGNIIAFSVRNKLIIALFTIALVIWGVISLTKLPIDAVPDITNNQVQVITISPSLAAPEVERLITFPIEQANSNIPGITEIRSFSRFGLSLVTIVFDDETDVYWARQQISERLQLVRSQIPSDAGNPELAPVTTGLGEIFQYSVRPKKGYESKYDAMELRTIQDWIIRRQLLGTPGVADVSSFGGFLKEYEVAVDPDKLKSLNVTVDDVFSALEKNNQNTGGAYIEKGPTVLFIRSEGLAGTIDDINKIVVKQLPTGMPVLIGNVAEVRIGHANRYGAMVYNDQGEVAGAVVMMLKGENSSRVIKDVKNKIVEIQKTLPEGVVIDAFLDRSKMVNNAISTVKKNLLEGAIIVVLILVLFLGNLRAGLIVASVIPLSMLFAIIMMTLFGVSGNLMSLGALDFGLIVDGAVIIVEAVMFRLYHSKLREQLYSQHQMNETVKDASKKMMGAAVFGQIIILIVYLPILSLVGIEGKMFKPMAQTVSFALIGAFILSLTYIPMITSLLLSKKIREHHTLSDRMMESIQRFYKPVLLKAMQFPKTIVMIAVVLFLAALLILSKMGGEFIPELEEGDFAVDTRVLTGSSLSTTVKMTQKTAGVLKNKFPEVEEIVTKIGSGEIPTDPMPIEAADMMVILKDKSEWTSAKSFDELADKMSKELQVVPGVSFGFQFPVQMRFNELMTGSRQDVVCKIFGENLDSLAQYSKSLGDIVQTVDGATDLYLETITGLPQIVINFNRDALAMYKLNIQDVNRVIRTAFAGESAGKIYENERRFDLVVRLKNTNRRDVTDVQQLLIPTPGGTQVPLYHVADVSVREGPNQIQREDAKRRIVVGFNVRGRDVESIVEELQKKVSTRMKMQPGYYITYGGQFENLVEAKNRLSIAVPIALLLIFVMLYFAFGSIKHGLLIFSAIPLSAIGGVFALWLRGMPFSISAGIGFIALFGVAVLNGIVLITEFNRLKKEGLLNMQEIIIQGTAIRLRPVLMTAAVASLGFLPMALSNGAGAEVQRPLATVVIGGLITATVLTLLVLPVLYAWFNKVRMKKNAVTLILLLTVLSNVQAQTKNQPVELTLSQMIDSGRSNNLLLKSGLKQIDYWQQMRRASFDPGKTSISGEYGNVNSFNTDTRFNLTQDFQLPNVYRRHSKWYDANRITAESRQNVLEKDLARDISLSYIELIDLLERKKMLASMDSVYASVSEKAKARFNAGETNMVEASSSQAQLQQLRIQEQQIDADIFAQQKILNYLLNISSPILPAYTDPKIKVEMLIDTSLINQHPLVIEALNHVKISSAQAEVERNGLAPTFMLGYSNQSFKGWQSRDGISQEYFSGSDRFHIVQGGVAFPIFTQAAKAKIKAAETQVEIGKINASYLAAQLQSQLQSAIESVNKWKQHLDYYEKEGAEYAREIREQSELSFSKGEINYIQWSMLMNQSYSIILSGLEALKNYNAALVELQYYLPSNTR